jgi:flavin reductase (DIM6/NTAB) family NADH-FMN oxidoreductase RutF
MRKVPQPVVVVTTARPEKPEYRRGITVSSFTSIALHPFPLISFCVRKPSRASDLLHEAGRFVVQVLSSHQVQQSIAFSSPNQEGVDQFKDVPFYSDPQTHNPVLMGSVGAMHCSTHNVFVLGDHELWVAKVDRVDHGVGSMRCIMTADIMVSVKKSLCRRLKIIHLTFGNGLTVHTLEWLGTISER